MEIPFIGGAYTSRSKNANAQRCVNLYPKIDNMQAKSKVILAGTPGLTQFAEPTAPIAPPDITENLYIHYKCEENGFDSYMMFDEQGNHYGSLENFPEVPIQWDKDGVDGGSALEFNPSAPGDYVDINDPLVNVMVDSFTWMFWCKMDDGRPPGDQYFCGSRYNNLGAYHQFMVYLDTSGVLVSYYGNTSGGANFTTLNPVWDDGAASSFTHVCTTVEQHAWGVQILIYIDGALSESHATLNGVGTAMDMSGWSSPNNMYIGAYNRDASLWYNMDGLLDDIRVYTVAQPAATVEYIYNLYSGA